MPSGPHTKIEALRNRWCKECRSSVNLLMRDAYSADETCLEVLFLCDEDMHLGNPPPSPEGPFRPSLSALSIGYMTECSMLENALCSDLLTRLAQRYEEDPGQFVHLPQPTVASSVARQTVAELRNEGYVEEEIRGVIRLTARGYQAYRRKSYGTRRPWA